MCIVRTMRPSWILRVLPILVVGIVLPIGLCQNAEPRGSFGTRSVSAKMDPRKDRSSLDDVERRFNWDEFPGEESSLDEDVATNLAASRNIDGEEGAPAAPRPVKNEESSLFRPEETRSALRRAANLSTWSGGGGRSSGIGAISGNSLRARKKNQRGKEGRTSSSGDPYGLEAREFETKDKGAHRRDGLGSKRARDPRTRKYRAERRRRRKNRDRKRGGGGGRKRSRQNDELQTSNGELGEADGPGGSGGVGGTWQSRKRPSPMASLTLANGSSSGRSSLDGSNDSTWSWPGTPSSRNETTTRSSARPHATTESSGGRTTLRHGVYAENVERVLSKQLEREITRSGLIGGSSVDDRILLGGTRKEEEEEGEKEEETKKKKNKNKKKASTSAEQRDKEAEDKEAEVDLRKEETSKRKDPGPKFGNSRYDAEKMLGYTKTEEDLPILDLEHEVLARTLNDYNAYMLSSLKLSVLERREEEERAREEEKKRRKCCPIHRHDQPILIGRDDPRDSSKLTESSTSSTLPLSVSSSSSAQADTYDNEDDAGGDLSCINGTFLPAPLARHALIKYVKSSIPGHEYLEADYECAPGFYMASAASRLLCRKRQWIGQVPKCKVKQSIDGVCAEASCEHVCKEQDGRAVCSCYKGFRLDGYKCRDVNECEESNGGCEYKCVNTPGSFRCECPKGMKQGEDRFTCMDVNECLLNNGHGPCQDTCRNLVGGYECSCESLQYTVLSADNHTCQDAGPCSVNNAGCSHTCLSTMGRVFCLCPDGFMLEDDWKTCQDIDECAVPDLQTEVCRYGCINTPGSYRCAEPMELKDRPVSDGLSMACLPGYEQNDAGSCTDINECDIDNGGCSEVCENTDGNFFCACDGDEKALSSDGKSCLGDDLDSPSICKCSEVEQGDAPSDSATRTHLWGKIVHINDVACPPLNPAKRGYLMCSRSAMPKLWQHIGRKATNRPGTKCFLKCPYRYQLRGEYELTCRPDGTWDGPKHGECVRYSKPRLECPKDVVAELSPGRDEAFVTFDQPSTDLDWFRYVHSNPSWGTRLEANLKVGVHEVTFFARHPVSKKQASCVLRIIVKEGEAPKVKNCTNDIEVSGDNGTAITWVEPIFTDNVKVMRISSNESPGRTFDVGGHRIEYEAFDEAGWSSKCVFTVVLRQE